MTDTKTRIYIANLGKYNEGKLVGEWIDLPFEEEELEALFVRIGLGQMVDEEYEHGLEVNGVVYEEYAIHDYETELEGLEIGEYYNDFDELNNLISQVEELDEWQLDTLRAALECFGEEVSELMERLDDFNLYSDIHTEEDLGYYYAVESGCYEIDDKNPLSNYIDYERFGRDINLESSGGFTSYGWIEDVG